MADTTAGFFPPTHYPTRPFTADDVREALRLGWRDFMRRPSSILFLFVVYPLIGIGTYYIALRQGFIHLLYPLAAGFALVGPVASAGVMELSRRHEAGEDPNLRDAFTAYTGRSGRRVLTLSAILFGLFILWMFTAEFIMRATLGEFFSSDILGFLQIALTTPGGIAMFLIGNAIGFLFAVAALVIGVVSMPMLVDGERSVTKAIGTSVWLSMENPVGVATWGITVAVGLAIGMLPVFAGLLIVLPVLGHANWHLYRRVVKR